MLKKSSFKKPKNYTWNLQNATFLACTLSKYRKNLLLTSQFLKKCEFFVWRLNKQLFVLNLNRFVLFWLEGIAVLKKLVKLTVAHKLNETYVNSSSQSRFTKVKSVLLESIRSFVYKFLETVPSVDLRKVCEQKKMIFYRVRQGSWPL